MGAGTSLFLIAAGAILNYAITPSSWHGFDLDMIGRILMVVGVIGLVLSLVFWSSWGGFHRRTYVEDGPVVRRRTDEYL